MRQMQPVLWTKGVLLTPQHLQVQDRFLEDLLQFELSTLTYAPWGFHQVEVDREALAGGAFALSSARGIFPDGLLFDMPVSDPLPAPRILEGAWEPDQTVLDVYLAVPEYQPGGYNVSASGRRGDTRYQAEVLMRRDENTGLAEKPIQVARKNCRFLVEGEALEGNSTIRVARINKLPTGEYQLDPHFIPPIIDIGASPYLMAVTRRLVEILSSKSSVLAGTRRQKNQSLAEFGISDVANFWLLYTINTYLPLARHLFEVRRGHPSMLWETMLALTGALTTFSTVVHPRDLPSYEHENLSQCFGQLDETLRTLLDTVVPAGSVSLPMQLVQSTLYATALDQDRYLTAPQLFLAIAADAKRDDIILKVPHLVKLSSADYIERLVRQALPGVPLTYVPQPPGAIPVKLNYHYFMLTKTGPDWDAIVRARNVAAHVPADLPNPVLELVILLPPK